VGASGRLGVVAATIALGFAPVTQAAAIHLFPIVPGDPGGDCAAKMRPDPGKAAAHVTSEGFFFIDEASNSSTTTIKRGQSVTWEFLRFCHSVTSVSVPKGAKKFSTNGGKGSAKGFAEGQDQLVKPDGTNSTYTVTFKVPGTYRYDCIHHASVGMTGTVVVTHY
jgi:plastocyanin